MIHIDFNRRWVRNPPKTIEEIKRFLLEALLIDFYGEDAGDYYAENNRNILHVIFGHSYNKKNCCFDGDFIEEMAFHFVKNQQSSLLD